MSLIVKAPPAVEPLSLPEVKAHLRVDINDDDVLIQNAIRTARWNLERRYRRACITQSLVLGLDYFGQADWDVYSPVAPMGMWGVYQAWSAFPRAGPIELRPPLQSVTSIKYTDPAGVVQTLSPATYVLDTSSEPGRVAPAIGSLWPVTGWTIGAVNIEFVCGYTTPDLVPDDIKAALKLIVGNLYENREQSIIGTRLVAVQIPYGVDELMQAYESPLVR